MAATKFWNLRQIMLKLLRRYYKGPLDNQMKMLSFLLSVNIRKQG